MIEEEYAYKFVEEDTHSIQLSEESLFGRIVWGIGDHVRDKVRIFMLKILLGITHMNKLCGDHIQIWYPMAEGVE